jgi:integron integrase
MDSLFLPDVPKPRLLDQVRQIVRRRGYAAATEQAYCHWIKRFVLFHNKRHPDTMAVPEVEQFLSYLVEKENVAAATQNQALSALLFLYKHVLSSPLDERVEASRAKRYKHIPNVISVDEVRRLLSCMDDAKRLMAELTYGAGLRLLEVHRIRVGHLDFENHRIKVLDGKGRKDRITLLPRDLVEPLLRQVRHVAEVHAADLSRGLGAAVLPYAFHRKSKEASRQLHWQFLFPSPTTFVDPKTGNSGRWHVNASGLQLAVSKAAAAAKLHKRVTVHTLRHSFATHMLRDGCDIRTLQVLLGHGHVNTTMVYAHINDNFTLTTRSPLDRHALHTPTGQPGHPPSQPAQPSAHR